MYQLMIVEDERNTREGLQMFFQRSRYPILLCGVFEAAHPALKAIAQTPPDILITDIVMPELLGTDFARMVHEEHPGIQIIMISGHQNIDFIKQGLKCGICDYLLKPIDLAELDETLQKALRNCARGSGEPLYARCDPAKELRGELRGILEYIHLNYARHITLQSLADEAFLTPAYISAIFKKEIGETFSDYLTHLRVEKSKVLLSDHRLKIAEVARRVGYDDPAYYTKVFHRCCGVNPVDYRRQGEKTQ